MPIYSFENQETGEVNDHLMKYSEVEQFLEDNKNLKQIITGCFSIVGGTGDRTKAPSGFKEVLSKISDANPSSNLASDYGKKDAKSVKVREAVQQVKKRLGKIND